ncbi:phosphate binding protein [Synechococcus sp. PCC 7502]|uniref:PstS family phosphate ABC transporter substrate-binding protein n=1 Tax=Synechococcus sp. PCC 7502 TaxID=1173263 RepID=UPI00029FAE4B|nr:PstS family phosphate ABC transporter substrate-binding protein [Synechococcus sp. PCC 7502]AFY72257.1 phosphate binding protein [Synechococcus sp. PCC 7502]
MKNSIINSRQAFTLLVLVGTIAIASQLSPMQASVDNTVKVDGSSTVYPITKEITKNFNAANPTIKVEVNFSGTTGGFKKFCAGEIDISDASRPITKTEMAACKKAGISYYELPIAYDALTVVVNPKNTWIKDITVAELKKIWEPSAEGKIKRWNQIRPEFPNQPITLFAPGKDSGTYDYFNAAINGNATTTRKDVTTSEDDNVLVKGVSQNPNSLGYFGFAYYETHAKDLKAVAVDSGKGAILPSRQAVEAGKYQPLARPLFIYVSAKSFRKPEVKSFVNFYLKEAPQSVVTVQYIPLPARGYKLAESRLVFGRVGTIFAGKTELNLSIGELLGKELAL